MRTKDIHVHVSERFLHAFCMRVSIARDVWSTFVRCMVRNNVYQFLFRCSRQIRYWAVDRLFLHFRDFLHRQFTLSSIWRGSFLVALDKLATEPAKNIICYASRISDVGVFGKPTWLESLIGELFHQALKRHAILQRDRS